MAPKQVNAPVAVAAVAVAADGTLVAKPVAGAAEIPRVTGHQFSAANIMAAIPPSPSMLEEGAGLQTANPEDKPWGPVLEDERHTKRLRKEAKQKTKADRDGGDPKQKKQNKEEAKANTEDKKKRGEPKDIPLCLGVLIFSTAPPRPYRFFFFKMQGVHIWKLSRPLLSILIAALAPALRLRPRSPPPSLPATPCPPFFRPPPALDRTSCSRIRPTA